jgi:hypothetical protein
MHERQQPTWDRRSANRGDMVIPEVSPVSIVGKQCDDGAAVHWRRSKNVS